MDMMDTTINSSEYQNSDPLAAASVFTVSLASNDSNNDNAREEIIRIIQSTVASVGIVANLTVIVVFLNHKRLRRKIPNMFIINQVRQRNIVF